MDVSIIIINYNTIKLIRNCLSSVFKHTIGISFEVIVSDNGSTDGSVEMIKNEFPQVILLENNANLGFGAANNRGLEIAKGKYVFYLNSDTVLLNNSVKMFFDYWENADNKDTIGALGANLLQSDLTVGHSFACFPTFSSELKSLLRQNFVFFLKTIFRIFHIKYSKFVGKKQIYEPHIGEVGYITGADLFLLNNEFARFDEIFFMFFEEVSLERKLDELKLRRIIIDGPKIIHYGGASNKYIDDFYFILSNSHKFYCESRIKYIEKFYGTHKASVIKFLTKTLFMNPLFLLKERKK